MARRSKRTIKVEGVKQVLDLLTQREKKLAKGKVSFEVGYTQSYAIYVHENLQAYHPVGRAKYLEEPARRLKKPLTAFVKAQVAKGMKMEDALLLAGLKLQAESQKLVPVDTGALRGSAYTRLV